MDQNQSLIAYDGSANDYQRSMRECLLSRLARQRLHSYLREIVDSNSIVADIGCGTGEDALFLKSHTDSSVYALDRSTDMLACAEKLFITHLGNDHGIFLKNVDLNDFNSMNTYIPIADVYLLSFGVIDFVLDAKLMSKVISEKIDERGHLLIMATNPICLVDIAYHIVRLRRLPERLNSNIVTSKVYHNNIETKYRNQARMILGFSEEFSLHSKLAFGAAMPPAHLNGWYKQLGSRAKKTIFGLDNYLSETKFGACIADMVLYHFVKNSKRDSS